MCKATCINGEMASLEQGPHGMANWALRCEARLVPDVFIARYVVLTVKQNIASIQLADTRVCTLSKSGRIYVPSAKSSQQSSKVRGGFLPVISAGFWDKMNLLTLLKSCQRSIYLGEKGLWTSFIAYFNLLVGGLDLYPSRQAVTISLASTSLGRVFAHPITKKANWASANLTCQRNLDATIITQSLVTVELHPKGIFPNPVQFFEQIWLWYAFIVGWYKHHVFRHLVWDSRSERAWYFPGRRGSPF